MRWARLFDDLDAQAAAAEQAERSAESAELRRLEVSRQDLAARLRGAVGSPLSLAVEGVGAVEGVLRQVGADWLLTETHGGAETVVALRAVSSAVGLPGGFGPPPDDVDRRFGIGFVLRRLARDRAAVSVAVRSGEVHTGTIDRVGEDFLDLAEHAGDQPRRSADVRRVRAIATDAVAVVRPA